MPLHANSSTDADSSVYERVSDASSHYGLSKRRKANLFDAVAGRVSTNGLVKDLAYGQQEAILAPEEALFKLKKAPERFEEDDFYWADRHLPPDCLPESDLLEAIHVFASDYYHYAIPDSEQINIKSLDGSALLALGILLEESARNVLGETGDLAFVEGQLFRDAAAASAATTDVEQQSESNVSIKVTASRSRDSSRRSTKRQRR